jgi:DeoR/GlpR family transcriptional regulator of sugar metabolism
MRVAASVVTARRESLAGVLANRYLPLAEVCAKFRISAATARRDLRVLQRERKITRTYGGALGAFDAAFTSFADRRTVDQGVKAQLARRALPLVRPRTTCFFDSGTTVFALAEALCRQPVEGLRAVTNSLPVAEILGRTKMEVYLLGGRFLQRQSILLGAAARRSARLWKFDQVFLGAEGFSRGGVWASEPEVAAFQKVLLARAREVIVCAHAAKLGRETGVFLAPWMSKFRIVTDVPPGRLRRQGVPV